MIKSLCCLVVCINLFIPGIFSQSFSILQSMNSPQAEYAEGMIRRALAEKKYLVKESKADFVIRIVVNAALQNEAFDILPAGKTITITGGDQRGVIYGSLSFAEDIRNGIPLNKIKAGSEKPHVPFRAIKFDLPWDTYRHSHALDLHVETCRDVNYWKAFLDMMVENRFNTLSLWNLHPYTYMIRPKNFPEASPFNDKEMKEWQELFHSIFRMAKERAIDTYIFPFNIFVSPAFAKAHNVAMDNLEHHFFGKGDTTEIIRRYTRESVAQVLEEYPELSGFGLTHGEFMGGMTPQQREDWLKETIIAGMGLANRKSKLVHRIPLSANVGSGGSTSIEAERLTRIAIESEAKLGFIEGPIWADLKFNWSHAHSTPKLVKVHGGKLYDTYFKPEPSAYKVTWTARNEDFFCLRWGVPDFIRAHIAANTPSYVGGYFVGSECYIPAKDYFTKLTGRVNWKYAFERQWLFYKLWGRLLYNPATPDQQFRSAFTRRYGKAGDPLLEASSLAGKTPLRLASLFDFTWDFTLYSEGFMALDPAVKRVEYISVNRLINQPPTDPDYLSVSAYTKAFLADSPFEKGKITPPILAKMLEQDCSKALELVKNIKTSGNISLLYEVADIKVWAYLGLHLAEKIKGAVALQTYRLKGGEVNKQIAVKHLENALRFWETVAGITGPIYNDMPLVHYSEQNGERSKENANLLFHWQRLTPDVARDVAMAKSEAKR